MAPACTNCGFDNPPGMRFCGNCGTRMPELHAPVGDPAASPTVVDPRQLGVLTGADLLGRFQQAGLEASGQRRSVTVLFVDLTAYTHLSEQLGDEELYDMIDRFIRVMVDDVYKYEGMVDKLTGDGLMALFGAPIAHENNAERALRSAMDMMTDVARLSEELDLPGQELRIHIGLNAGSVIVGGLGSDGLMNYTAIGDSVNLARRLDDAADPDTILVSESVYRQTSRLFDFEKQPPMSLKNVSRPVAAYRLLGPKERPGTVRGIEGLRAPMIGREHEYWLARERIDRLVDDQQGGLILLVGEGGMGKSRLVSELKASLDTDGLRIIEGHSLTYRKSIAYWIFQDLLRSFLGLPASSTSPEAVSAAIVAAAPAKEALPYLEHVLGLEASDPAAAERIRYLTPGQLRQQIFMAVRDLLVAEAHRKPLLLIMEDLHWADDASLDLLRFMIDTTAAAPLLICAVSRPFEGGAVQAIHERASLRLSERYLFLRLQALPPAQSSQLLQALVKIKDLPETLSSQIIQRSAGLPFYLEEILRMLIENKIIYQEDNLNPGDRQWQLTPGADISTIGVPETLQGLILTRVDRLSAVQRRILQTASVIGYQFASQVLRKVLAELSEAPDETEVQLALDYLLEHEFILPYAVDVAEITDGQQREETFQFRHVLVSDTVYSTLLQRDRRDLHTRVGRAVEEIYADRLDGMVEVLASHFLRSPMLDRALHYLLLAGQKAAHSFANDQARQHFLQALEVLNKTSHRPEQACAVHFGLGDGLLTAGDYPSARDHFNLALAALGGRAGTSSLNPERVDPAFYIERKRQVSRLQRKIAQTYEGQGDYEKALGCLRPAQALLDNGEASFMAERASILSDIGWIYFRRGGLDQAELVLREALALAEAAGQPDVLASVLNRLAGIFFQRDDPSQAAGFLARSLILRENIGDVVGVARSYNNLGLLNWKQGDLAGALSNFNHSFKLQANLGDVEGLIVLHTNMGLIELDLGDLSEAEGHFLDALNSSIQIGHHFHICEARMNLALLGVYSGDWRRALEHGHLGLTGFQELGVSENQLDLYVSMGWAYLGLGDEERLEEVIQQIQERLTDSVEGGPLEGEGRALRLLARIAGQRGELDQARAALEKSAAVFTQVGNPMEHARVLVDMASLLLECGKTVEASMLLDRARETFSRMGARLELERMQVFQ